MPIVGSYVCKFTLFGVPTGSPLHIGGPGYEWGPSLGTGLSGVATYTAIGNCFSLNGGALISFNGLPSGFTPLSVNFRKTGGGVVGSLSNGNLLDSAHATTAFGIFGPQQTNLTAVGTANIFPPSVIGASAIDLIALFTISINLSFGSGADVSLLAIVLENLEIFGNYDIVAVPFTPPVTPIPTLQGTTKRVGERVKIISTLKDLDDVEEIKLDFGVHTIILKTHEPIINVDGVDIYGYNFIEFFSEDEIWFDIPLYFDTYAGPYIVTIIYFPGTQFSGSVLLGTLNILYEDASGIYRFIKNKTNDTLYFRDGFTTDVSFLMLPEDEIIEDDFFSFLSYPYRILAKTEDDEEINDFTQFASLREVVVTEDVNIPTSFIKTAFLP